MGKPPFVLRHCGASWESVLHGDAVYEDVHLVLVGESVTSRFLECHHGRHWLSSCMDIRGCAPRSRSVGAYVQSLWSSGRPTRLSLGSLSLVEDLTLKRGLGHTYTNWSGVEAEDNEAARMGSIRLLNAVKANVPQPRQQARRGSLYVDVKVEDKTIRALVDCRAASTIVVRWSPSAHACHRVPRVESP
ncbi:hypothetical protein ACLB2K_007083 [Fragaria x ananassa]